MTRNAEVRSNRDWLPARAVSGGDGPGIDVGEPNHDFIDIGTSSSVRGEQIISDIGNNGARSGLRPIPSTLRGVNVLVLFRC